MKCKNWIKIRLTQVKLMETEICLNLAGGGGIFGSVRTGTSSDQTGVEEKKVGGMRYVTKLRDSELSIRWIDRM